MQGPAPAGWGRRGRGEGGRGCTGPLGLPRGRVWVARAVSSGGRSPRHAIRGARRRPSLCNGCERARTLTRGIRLSSRAMRKGWGLRRPLAPRRGASRGWSRAGVAGGRCQGGGAARGARFARHWKGRHFQPPPMVFVGKCAAEHRSRCGRLRGPQLPRSALRRAVCCAGVAQRRGYLPRGRPRLSRNADEGPCSQTTQTRGPARRQHKRGDLLADTTRG
jgi:hypothetical protein